MKQIPLILVFALALPLAAQQMNMAGEGSFTDPRDGQNYRTITVGDHIWMAENLNYEAKGSWCWGDNPENGAKYGRLYKFNTAIKVAPEGWHVATDAEWDALEESVGGNEIAGKYLKSTSDWSGSGNGNDSIGFGALPGGDRYIDGTYRHLGKQGSWWSAGPGAEPLANRRLMGYDYDYVYNHERGIAYSRYVRCVKDYPLEKPRFEASIESLKQYECPEWFRDAKFGIYVTWGVYTVAETGEWYPRYMYWEGTDIYQHHLLNYGHPSEFGYADFIPMWKAENFDPDFLLSLFKQAGAKYFTPCAVHHDNFDLWDSKHHKWNAVNMGPKKDIIGLWKEATHKAGLRFGVTTHLARSYTWMNTANGADTRGPKKGVPYDALQGKGKGLYPPDDGQSTMLNPQEDSPRAWKESWLKRIQQLIDDYEPDHMYFDGAVPFAGSDQGQTGMDLMAHYYNTRPEGFLCFKKRSSGIFEEGIGSLDHERGKAEKIYEDPWQTDDALGPWSYIKGATYMTPDIVVDKLIDIVSKNGNMLLCVPIKADGTLDEETTGILKDVGNWFEINGDAIYGTRPWYTSGEGENIIGKRDKISCMSSSDIRFVTKKDVLYAFVLDWPEGDRQVLIKTLGSSNPNAGDIESVELLGFSGKLKWKQEEDGLNIIFPKKQYGSFAFTLKIRKQT